MTTIVTRTPVEVVELWVKTLRNGEYKQGKHRLRNSNNTFCCLGVLCDLARKDGGEDWEVFASGEMYAFGKESNTHLLPSQFKNYLELTDDTVTHLMQINDLQDDPFPTIANILEKTVLPHLKERA